MLYILFAFLVNKNKNIKKQTITTKNLVYLTLSIMCLNVQIPGNNDAGPGAEDGQVPGLPEDDALAEATLELQVEGLQL